MPLKDKVDVLLRLNPDYGNGRQTLPIRRFPSSPHLFTRQARDEIKTKGYNCTRDKVDSPTAGQNISYSDKNQHPYWHYKDINWSPDGTPLPPQDPVDLVTQLKLMIAALPASSGACDDVRSYDLVWICTLSEMGISRFTEADGIRGKFRMAMRAAMPNR